MTKLFRNYKITIQEQGNDEIVITYPLTVDFAISRATWSMSGTARIRLYNLSKENRGSLYKNRTELSRMIKIKFEAGYGDVLSTIFEGDILWCNSYRMEGKTDFITEIDCFGYSWVFKKSVSDWSVSGLSCSKKKVIERLCGDLKTIDFESGDELSIPVGAIGDFSEVERRSYVASGNTWDLLKTETEGNCYIDNGKVFCLRKNEAVEGSVLLINSETGLLGTPKVDGLQLEANMIFEPGLIVGQEIQMDSSTQDFKPFNGVYKTIQVDHSGTISGAVCGECKTRVVLMIGSQGQDDPFDIIEGE